MIPVNELSRGYKLFQEEYEKKAIEVLRSGWYILGKEVECFENEFSKQLGKSGVECFTAGVDNGLNAIHVGLVAAGIKAGDEIIVQANGYIATVLAVLQCGAIPIFVEPDEYFAMDASKIKNAITPKTKAVLVTHLYGLASRMEAITQICKENNLLLFEDCAQSHFATYRGIPTGLFGDAGFFSFYPTKNLGAFGDAGAVVSKDKAYIEKVKVLRNYGSDYRYHNIEVGFNSRLDELQAGLLRIKLLHYDELIMNRRSIAKQYLERIHNPKIILPSIPEETTHIWYQFVIRVDDQERFQKYMLENEIKTDISWKVPPYRQPALVYMNYQASDFLVTEKMCQEIVSLPMMDYMEQEEIDKVICVVNRYV